MVGGIRESPGCNRGEGVTEMDDRRKDSASSSTPASAKPKPSWRPDVQIQNQQADCERSIHYARQSAVRWLADNPSAEERQAVLTIHEELTELNSIIARRFKRDYRPEDGPQWSATIAHLLSLQNEVGDVCAAFVEKLPKKLPGVSVAALADENLELPTWAQIRSWKIITQKRTSDLLNCDVRTVHNYIHKYRRLNETTGGKVCCDEKLKIEMQKKYGSAFHLT